MSTQPARSDDTGFAAMPPMERAVVFTFMWTAGCVVAVSLPLLAIDVDGGFLDSVLFWFIFHLTLLVAVGIGLAVGLAPIADEPWFVSSGWSVRSRAAASGVSVVALVTGSVALVTLASSAALRYDPSLQFLQLLSALDIAWAGAAIVVGATRLWGRVAGIVGGVILGVFCIGTIWNYLDTVGFGPDGQWIVRGDDLMRLVIVWDMVAGIVAVAIFLFAVYRTGDTEQARPQS